MVVQPIAPFAQGPTILLITRSVVNDGVRWVEVLLPMRPNGSRGWIPADVLSLSTTPVRIAIDISERRLTLLRAGRRVFTTTIAVGTPGTPTPTGRTFAIAEHDARPTTRARSSARSCCRSPATRRRSTSSPGATDASRSTAPACRA